MKGFLVFIGIMFLIHICWDYVGPRLSTMSEMGAEEI